MNNSYVNWTHRKIEKYYKVEKTNHKKGKAYIGFTLECLTTGSCILAVLLGMLAVEYW